MKENNYKFKLTFIFSKCSSKSVYCYDYTIRKRRISQTLVVYEYLIKQEKKEKFVLVDSIIDTDLRNVKHIIISKV